MKIANTVICYENEEEVIRYAEQLRKQTHSDDVVLYIVINKHGKIQSDEFESRLQQTGLKFRIIDANMNLGYLNGLVLGAKSALEDENYSWFIFSNTDIVIPDKNFIETMEQLPFYNDNSIWLAGPSVYAPEMSQYVNPYKVSRPSKWGYIKTNIGLTFPALFDKLYSIKKKLTKSNNAKEDSCSRCVYAVHGSFMFLRKELVEILLNKPDWEILFDEEPYLAEIVNANGKKVYYESKLLVHHLEGASTGKTNIKWKYSVMKKSNRRMIREFY